VDGRSSVPIMLTDILFRWESNEMMINVSCDALGYSGVPNPGREELDGILDAISAESKESGLDQRFILAVMVSSQPLSGVLRFFVFLSILTHLAVDRCKNPRVVCEQSRHHHQAT